MPALFCNNFYNMYTFMESVHSWYTHSILLLLTHRQRKGGLGAKSPPYDSSFTIENFYCWLIIPWIDYLPPPLCLLHFFTSIDGWSSKLFWTTEKCGFRYVDNPFYISIIHMPKFHICSLESSTFIFGKCLSR